jgi:hypothetical protein
MPFRESSSVGLNPNLFAIYLAMSTDKLPKAAAFVGIAIPASARVLSPAYFCSCLATNSGIDSAAGWSTPTTLTNAH